ncbi:MAG: LacI family transcriptional regulator [Verrucomicrobia bacterium]|nr:LacI family transcriptional regulator [Verrucomicrobiota bacterium]
MAAPTLKTIALKAGVSINTVSLALRNSPRISVATRTLVHGIARELNYCPNPYVSALMSSVSRNKGIPRGATLAFLGEFPLEICKTEHPYLYRFYTGARKQAADYGFALDYFVAKGGPTDSAQLSRIIASRGIQGVIAVAINPQHPRLELKWENFSAVIIGFGETSAPLHRIENDQIQSMDLAIERIVASGKRRPGMYFCWSHAHRPLFERYTMAFRQALVRHGLAQKNSLHFTESPNIHDFYDWVDRSKIDVVLCLHSTPLFWLRDAGYILPEDIGFICCDLRDEDINLKISGIRYNHEAVGETAVHVVSGLVRRNTRGAMSLPSLTTLPGLWVSGSTV